MKKKRNSAPFGALSFNGALMDWIESALANPQENWSIWAIFALLMARIVWGSLGVMLSMSKNTNQDNAHQTQLLQYGGQLMKEMAAWRDLFQRQDEERAKIQREMMDLYKNSMIRIDATTQATLQNTIGLGQSGEKHHKKLVSIEGSIKRLLQTLEEKKVMP